MLFKTCGRKLPTSIIGPRIPFHRGPHWAAGRSSGIPRLRPGSPGLTNVSGNRITGTNGILDCSRSEQDADTGSAILVRSVTAVVTTPHTWQCSANLSFLASLSIVICVCHLV
jgi:hypothetical protein